MRSALIVTPWTIREPEVDRFARSLLHALSTLEEIAVARGAARPS
jgi:hypothetical protein